MSVPRAVARELAPASAADEYRKRFRQLVDEHGSNIARTLRYLGVASRDLDDAVQEVFEIAHRRWGELRPEGSLGGWLRGVAVNVARNRRRAQGRAARKFAPELAEPVDPRMPEEQIVERQRCEKLLSVLAELPDDLRTALVLFEIESASMKEVADALGVSLPTAYRRVDDARTALRRALTKEER